MILHSHNVMLEVIMIRTEALCLDLVGEGLAQALEEVAQARRCRKYLQRGAYQFDLEDRVGQIPMPKPALD